MSIQPQHDHLLKFEGVRPYKHDLYIWRSQVIGLTMGSDQTVIYRSLLTVGGHQLWVSEREEEVLQKLGWDRYSPPPDPATESTEEPA